MVALTPMAVSKERTSCTNRGLVRKEPSENLKRGPSCAPCRDRNGTVAATGHRSCPVAPITIVTPARKGSVFEALIVINIFDGAVRLSKEIYHPRLNALRCQSWSLLDNKSPLTEETQKNRHSLPPRASGDPKYMGG